MKLRFFTQPRTRELATAQGTFRTLHNPQFDARLQAASAAM